MHKQWKKIISFICAGVALSACAGTGPEMKTVDYVDIDRFMGPWYVIANIPTFLEKGAHNAVETYSLNDDGTIGTTFTFRKNSFDGKPKEYNPKAFILDTDTYRIVYLDDDYTKTIIARQKRDFVWIMARTPTIDDAEYDDLVKFVEAIGYDTSLLQRVPQSW
jgi:apolipoprotein D and lipocalin family protein